MRTPTRACATRHGRYQLDPRGRAGIQALALSGHLDRSILHRYSITKEEDVKRVAQRLQRARAAQPRLEEKELWHESWHADSGRGEGQELPEAAKLKQ